MIKHFCWCDGLASQATCQICDTTCCLIFGPVVVGCGGDRDKGKRPMMAKIATDKSDVCIFTSDNPRSEEPCKAFSIFYCYCHRTIVEVVQALPGNGLHKYILAFFWFVEVNVASCS